MTPRSIAQHQPPGTPPSSSATGCYGLRLHGLQAGALLVDAPADWPCLRVAQVAHSVPSPELDTVGSDRAEIVLQTGGWIELEREPASATYHLPRRLHDGGIVHPYLAPGASVAARWAGRESFHASAVAIGGGAWGLLGDKGGGKSTMVAWLALHGHPVLTDDLLVVDGDAGLSGPRCLDLRGDAAARMGVGEPLGVIGVRERWRLALPPVAPRMALRGWIELAWGDAVDAERIPASERLVMLAEARSLRVPPVRPETLVDLSRLPAWRLRRPRDWGSMPEAAARLVELAAG